MWNVNNEIERWDIMKKSDRQCDCVVLSRAYFQSAYMNEGLFVKHIELSAQYKEKITSMSSESWPVSLQTKLNVYIL